ncbi:MAG: Nif3-like dinuclear metal center hexameric protein [Prevotellaceae bacterium]|jgi:dinuclear metal center YbgI/SA1388 family protein|nr:Nif3-like dinuclear metal center hexameric protein [Prevotellaceae bacterium]
MKITVNDICLALEELAPLALQENYDNVGLLVGNRSAEVRGVLLCIDITEEVVVEAQVKGCNMIVSHHPLIFKGLKTITGKNEVERCVISAIKNDLAIYACHTNIDSVWGGVSSRMAQKLSLINCKILKPHTGNLLKLVTFVPENHAETLRNACFEAGAGHIGNYDCCSFSSVGVGSFRANENCKPFVGKIGNIHSETEIRLEIILPAFLKTKITNALIQAHPYEEPAFDFIPLVNDCETVGFGIIGDLPEAEKELEFLQKVKTIFASNSLRYSALRGKPVRRIALCGGSGVELLNTAVSRGADVFISADFKYHDYFLPEKRLVLADIGHFESEQFTKEIFFEQLTKKIPKFAVRFSEINTNPINYL